MWWDYLVSPGDEVQYSIVPVTGPDKDHLTLSLADASAQTPLMTITGQASAHVSAYFNKGIVSAQWVSRALASVGADAKLDALIAQTGNSLRNALSGILRPQLLNMLDDVKKNGGEIYAALYELNDPELIPALVALGQKCHLILANGAFNAKKPDENSAVRAQLRGKVDLHDRVVSNGHFAHNKFIVACDSSGKPQRVLSGSTNWKKTGLCTQAKQRRHRGRPRVGRTLHRSMESAQGRCSRGCSIETRRRQNRAGEEGQADEMSADKVESRSPEEGASEDQESSCKVEARARKKGSRKDAESCGEDVFERATAEKVNEPQADRTAPRLIAQRPGYQ